MDGGSGLCDGVSKGLRPLRRQVEKVKGQPLSSFAANAWQLCKLFCEPFQSGRVALHDLQQTSQIETARQLLHGGGGIGVGFAQDVYKRQVLPSGRF